MKSYTLIQIFMKVKLVILLLGWFVISAEAQIWKPYGLGFNPPNVIFDLINFNNELIACGGITGSGPTSMKYIARWDGANWHQLGIGTIKTVPECMIIFNGDLIVGGSFAASGTIPNTKGIARWDGFQWNSMGDGIISGNVNSMASFNGSLYIGGNFSNVDSMLIRDIARWDGANWHSVCVLSLGLTQLFCMEVFNNELYIGGYFGSINGVPITNIAKFDGSNWSSVGGGLSGDVRDLYTDTLNNRLYAVGNFSSASGGSISCPSTVAYWDGTSWNPVGVNGPLLYGKEIYIHNNELYVGINTLKFNLNSDTLVGIVKWDGNDWYTPGNGLWSDTIPGAVHALLTFNNELAVGGGFTTAGTISANLIASWSDTTTSIQENQFEKRRFKIFPNPFSNTATVQLHGIEENQLPCKFELYDILGTKVNEINVNSLEFIIQNENLVHGIYSYNLLGKFGEEILKGKLVIE